VKIKERKFWFPSWKLRVRSPVARSICQVLML